MANTRLLNRLLRAANGRYHKAVTGCLALVARSDGGLSMPTDIEMPQMGADMQEGTLLKWLKHPGDTVARGEIIAEIETDKANIEIESFEAGVLQEVLANEGDVIPVGQVIARIAAAGEAAAAPPTPVASAAAQQTQDQAQSAEQTPPAAAPAVAAATDDVRALNGAAAVAATPEPVGASSAAASAPVAPAGRLRVSPVARHLAGEWGVDLNALHGSGPDGRIVRRDVEAVHSGVAAQANVATLEPVAVAEESKPSAVPDGHAEGLAASVAPATIPGGVRVGAVKATPAAEPELQSQAAPTGMSKMRQAIARRMAQSKREAPHYYVTAEIDMTEAMAFRAQLNAAADTKITVNDLIVKACAETLRQHPEFNALFIDGATKLVEQINICIGVALPDGLVAPALIDTGRKSLGAIAREARDLAERTRGGKLRPAELSEGTFTISNLGMFGVETLIAIIQPPQAAILGVGAVAAKPAVRDGAIVVRQLLMVALSADHRVTDGAQGGAFLRDLKALLEQPLRLAL
jgi:pyruvate dehydrogenase E2 component (dihydrolipoamide acetyltransferase)